VTSRLLRKPFMPSELVAEVRRLLTAAWEPASVLGRPIIPGCVAVPAGNPPQLSIGSATSAQRAVVRWRTEPVVRWPTAPTWA